MPESSSNPPHVNGILETSLYVESAARSAEFYRRVFGFEPLNGLCANRKPKTLAEERCRRKAIHLAGFVLCHYA